MIVHKGGPGIAHQCLHDLLFYVLFALHTIAASFDVNGLGVVEDAIEYGTCDGGVIVENDRPVAIGTVGGDDG